MCSVEANGLGFRGTVLALQGETAAARAAADATLEAGAELGEFFRRAWPTGVGPCGLGRRGCCIGVDATRGRLAALGCRGPQMAGGVALGGVPRPRWQAGMCRGPRLGR